MTLDSTLKGVQVVYGGKEPITADLVFVHGLGGHPIDSWSTAGVEAKRPSLIRRLLEKGVDKRTVADHENDTVFWPRDLLPKHVPHSRILTYGYETDVKSAFAAANTNNILSHGKNMLAEIQRARIDNTNRPLIFICHSFGGILTKVALKLSRDARYQAHLQSLYNNTYGVIFLGTPHRGSLWAPWGVLAANLSKLALQSPKTTLVKTLRVDDVTLATISDDFSTMIRNDIAVYSFREERGMSGIYGLHGKIVDDFSSLIGDAAEGQEGIDANHSDMCRFKSEHDPGYRKVSAEITRFMSEAKSKAKQAVESWPEFISYDVRQQLLRDRNLNRLDLEDAVVHLPLLQVVHLEVNMKHDIPSTQYMGNSIFELLDLLQLLPGQQNSEILSTSETSLSNLIIDKERYYTPIPRQAILCLICDHFHSIKEKERELSIYTDIGTFKFLQGPRGLFLTFNASERSQSHIAPHDQDFHAVQQAALGKFATKENLYASCVFASEAETAKFPIGLTTEWILEKPHEAIKHHYDSLEHLRCIRFITSNDYEALTQYMNFLSAAIREGFSVLDQYVDFFDEGGKVLLALMRMQWDNLRAHLDDIPTFIVISRNFRFHVIDMVDDAGVETPPRRSHENSLESSEARPELARLTDKSPSDGIRGFVAEFAKRRQIYNDEDERREGHGSFREDSAKAVDRLWSNRVVFARVVETCDRLETLYRTSHSDQALRAEIQTIGRTQLTVLAVLMSMLCPIAIHGTKVKDATVPAPERWIQLITSVGSDILVG